MRTTISWPQFSLTIKLQRLSIDLRAAAQAARWLDAKRAGVNSQAEFKLDTAAIEECCAPAAAAPAAAAAAWSDDDLTPAGKRHRWQPYRAA